MRYDVQIVNKYEIRLKFLKIFNLFNNYKNQLKFTIETEKNIINSTFALTINKRGRTNVTPIGTQRKKHNTLNFCTKQLSKEEKYKPHWNTKGKT